MAFDHDWCGVTQLGWDEKSQQKIAQMLSLGLPEEIARAVSAQEVADTAGVETGCGGIQYPLGGWLCPAELTAAVIARAVARADGAVCPQGGIAHPDRTLGSAFC